MRCSFSILSLALSLLAANPAKAVEPVLQPVAPPERSFSERLDPAALISGGVVMGLHVRGEAEILPADQRPRLLAIVPEAWGGHEMCARLSSSDGRYEAQIDYLIPAHWKTVVADLEFAPYTRYPGETSLIEPMEVAAVVSRGRCRTEPTLYAPAFWNAAPRDPGEGLSLLLNSYRASEVYLSVGEGAKAQLIESCEAVTDAPRTTFDFRCELEPEVVRVGEVTRVEVNRIRRRHADPPLVFYVDLSR